MSFMDGPYENYYKFRKVTIFNRSIISQLWEKKLLEHFSLGTIGLLLLN